MFWRDIRAAGKADNADASCSCLPQRQAAGIGGAPGCINIINQKNPFSLDRIMILRRNRKCSPQIFIPLKRSQSLHRQRLPPPLQKTRRAGDTASSAHSPRHNIRLVIASPRLLFSMHGNRHQQIKGFLFQRHAIIKRVSQFPSEIGFPPVFLIHQEPPLIQSVLHTGKAPVKLMVKGSAVPA